MACFKWLQRRMGSTNGKLKITDLDVNCLEVMFNHLNISDLLNVADSNETLKRAAGMVFLRRYSEKKIWLHKPRLSINRKLHVYSENIMIEDLKTCLQILRCFGDLIGKLEITEEEVSSDWEFTEKFGINQIIHNAIMTYVNDFCSKSLKQFALVMVPKSALNQLKKPFVALETLQLFSCCLSKNLLSLDVLFPNLQNLSLNFNKVDDATIIQEHWPHLKLFEVNIDRWNIQQKHVEEMLRVNPKLQSLKISSGWDADILKSVSKFLQFIECLEIGNHFGGFTGFDGDVIHFTTLKRLKMSLIGTEPGPMCTLPLSFQQLEELSIETNYELDETFFAFLRKNPTIKKLDIPALRTPILQVERFKSSKEFVNLTELYSNRFTFNADTAIDFISECKSLKKFHFKVESPEEYDDLLIQLHSGWHVSIDEHLFVQLELIPIESFVNYIHNFLDNLQFRQVYHY